LLPEDLVRVPRGEQLPLAVFRFGGTPETNRGMPRHAVHLSVRFKINSFSVHENVSNLTKFAQKYDLLKKKNTNNASIKKICHSGSVADA
jgi:hypothetical protein